MKRILPSSILLAATLGMGPGCSGPAGKEPLAGTVVAGAEHHTGVADAEVRMTDSAGTKFIARTDCAGNFKVTADMWDPKFPILVAVAKGGTLRRMDAPIDREASCATCHSPGSTEPPVYLFEGEEIGVAAGVPCP